MKKLTLTKAAAAVTAFAAALTAVTAVPAEMSAKADDFPALMTAEEAAAWTEMLGRFGFDSVQELLSDSRALPNVSRIKDLDGNGAANVLDAQYIFQFLSGRRMYGYDYSELDVTNDFVLNSADAQAYLQYVAYYMVQELNAPFSAHGASVTPDSSYEYRTYVKHLYSNGYTTANDTTYPLNASGILTGSGTNMLLNNSSPVMRSTNFSQNNDDTALIKNAGSGFIVGEHQILTNAHCVFSFSNQTYDSSPVYAYIPDAVSPEFVLLTPCAVHIPYNYYSTGSGNYDYAIIEVTQDLSDYGLFDLGLVLNGVDQNVVSEEDWTTDGTGLDVTVAGFPQANNLMLEGHRIYAGYSNGILDHLDVFKIYTTTSHQSGLSGGPIYSASMNKTVLGIHRTSNTYHDDEIEIGVRITRPILQFVYNNTDLLYSEE